MGILDIKNFSKVYKGQKKAVDNISLSVENGDVFGFIGHNGAGKSTTIKSVVGILDFEEGDIYIDGHSIKKEPLKCKSTFSYIPDSPELYEHLTGIQYLNFVADIFGVPEDVRVKRIKEHSGMFGITESLGNLISSYSHGMKQKLAITGAIIHEPKLLILDEPFVGLDPKAVVVLKEIMKKMTAKGNAIFFSTHVLDVAERLCNKVAMINHGKLVYSGTMDEIIQNQTLEEFFMKELKDETFSNSSKS
ncbi:ABC-2 type transport system ATP-binding protein [Lysinibacillus sp. AC-3]|nr:ABC-2 type transport system ATP-binding protein [Lysinibacillus sp. AC-3]